MRRALIAFGTLGGGTVIAFALAALAFLADPVGRVVPVAGIPVPGRAVAMPAPAILVDPAVPAPAVDGTLVAPGQGFVEPALPAEMQRGIEAELRRSGGWAAKGG